jgi:tRNA(adenine34) deaminase
MARAIRANLSSGGKGSACIRSLSRNGAFLLRGGASVIIAIILPERKKFCERGGTDNPVCADRNWDTAAPRESGVLFLLAMAELEADVAFMGAALAEARLAADRGEVPVGAVVVAEGRIVARAGNRTIADCDPTAHAEIIALREAAKAVGNYRLLGASLYVTIEPCAMCAGAMIQARIARLIYGADDAKAGAIRSCFSVLDHPQLNHRVEVTPGIRADEAAAVLKDFFAARR